MFCTKCGAQNVDGYNFCRRCGNALVKSQIPTPDTNNNMYRENVQNTDFAPNNQGYSQDAVNSDRQNVYSQQNAYAQQNNYNQQGAYAQQNNYNQQSAYAQQNNYNQQGAYAQQNNYNQQGAYARQNNYGQYGASGYQQAWQYNPYGTRPREITPAIKMLKKLASSPMFLIATIIYTLSFIAGVIVILGSVGAAFSNSYGMYNEAALASGLLVSLIAYAPTILTLIGLWMTFGSGVSRSNRGISTAGFTLLKVSAVINLVLICIAAGILLIGFIAGIFAAYAVNEMVPILFGFLIFAGIMTLVILYFAGIVRSINAAKRTIETGRPHPYASAYVAVMSFIAAALMIIGLAATAIAAGLGGGMFSAIALVLVIVGIVSVTMITLFGILILVYNSKMRNILYAEMPSGSLGGTYGEGYMPNTYGAKAPDYSRTSDCSSERNIYDPIYPTREPSAAEPETDKTVCLEEIEPETVSNGVSIEYSENGINPEGAAVGYNEIGNIEPLNQEPISSSEPTIEEFSDNAEALNCDLPEQTLTADCCESGETDLINGASGSTATGSNGFFDL